MDQSANVRSVEAISRLRSGLLAFQADARDGVTQLVLEVRRAVDWLENDRVRYWAEQYRRASEALAEARNELERRQLTYGSEEAPSCFEQKKAVELAKRRLRVCEEKRKAVQRWIRTVHSEMHEFEGQVARLNEVTDMDLPRSVAALERMLVALDKYIQASTPVSTPVSAPVSTPVSTPATQPRSVVSSAVPLEVSHRGADTDGQEPPR